ncbi:MAG: hypothetical protein JRH10_22570, partial [Deltaproteobacteria bacterium]|nr:hypothetical protein [Deltaproteobacteria bacterium]
MSPWRAVAAAILLLLVLVPTIPVRADGTEQTAPRHFIRVPAPDGIQIRRYNKTAGVKPGKKD